jgi:hypothetical protein
MASLDESDQTLTTSEVTDGTLVDGEESKKSRSGIFGLIAIASSFILILVSLLGNFSGTSAFEKDTDTRLHVVMNLSSNEFLTSSAANVCDGVGTIKGISTSTIKVAQGAWVQTLKVGSGSLNSQGKCIYKYDLYPPSDFKGGNIQLSATFPFGISPIFTVNVGTTAPWAPAAMTIPLD